MATKGSICKSMETIRMEISVTYTHLKKWENISTLLEDYGLALAIRKALFKSRGVLFGQ